MATREDLNNKFKSIMPEESSNNVYFQPPPSLELKYPCIIYELAKLPKINADNITYKIDRCYDVKYITKKATDMMPEVILKTFPMSYYNQEYINDGLYHHAFSIYY